MLVSLFDYDSTGMDGSEYTDNSRHHGGRWSFSLHNSELSYASTWQPTFLVYGSKDNRTSRLLFPGYCYAVVSLKTSLHLRQFSDLLCPIYVIIFPDSSRIPCCGCNKTPSSETGRNWARKVPEFCLSVSLLYLKRFLTCLKILRHGADGFTSPLKRVVLRIFIALENPLLSAGFEPASLGSSGKRDNHYTPENDARAGLCGVYS
jgi:hypothetical protein